MNRNMILFLLFLILPFKGLSQHIKFTDKSLNTHIRFSINKEFLIHTTFDNPKFYSRCKISNINGDSITIIHPTDKGKRLTLASSEILSFKVYHSTFKKISIGALLIGVGTTIMILGDKYTDLRGFTLPTVLLSWYTIRSFFREFEMSEYTIELVK